MFEMLKHMSPPLGLGKKCPARVAYKVDPDPLPGLSVLGWPPVVSRGLSVCLSAVLLSHRSFSSLPRLSLLPSQTEGHRHCEGVSVLAPCPPGLPPLRALKRLRKVEPEASVCLFSLPPLS